MQKELILTKSGYKKLAAERDFLVKVRRKEVAEKIKEAKELGDLTENSEYEDAKNEQAFIEGRIVEIETILKKAKVINKKGRGDRVSVGSKVIVELNSRSRKKMTFKIVGSNEGDPISGKISFDSPLGKALMNKKKNDKVEVETPGRKLNYKILDIC